MSITAPQQDVELEERTKDAWNRYAEELRERTGSDYVDAESDAWDRLQMDLADIAAAYAQAAARAAGADGI